MRYLLPLLLLAWPVFGEIVPSTRLYDWQLGVNVGVRGGIPAQDQTIYTNFTSSATAAQINAGIQNCPSNQVVKLGTGTYSLSTHLIMKDGVILRGTISNNTNATILKPSVNMDQMIIMGQDNAPTAGTAINTNGYAAGISNLTVTSTSGLAVGDLVSISQVINTNIMWDSDGTTTRPIRQQAIITAINSLVVTVWPPLHYGLSSSPRMDTFTQSTRAKRVGIEDLVLDGNAKAVTWGVLMLQASDCWMKNVRTHLLSNYHIVLYYCLFCEFTQCYIDDAPDYASNHAGFLVGNGSGLSSSACAFYDNIMYKVPPGIEMNGGSSGCIIAYNFVYDSQLQTYAAMGLTMNHGPECNYNLYEGNIANMIGSDGYFGGSLYDTILRNWALGWQPTYPTHGRALWLRNDTLYANVVGNVFGVTNITPAAQDPGNVPDWDSNYIYVFGDDGSSGEVRGYDTRVTNTMILHGNWDSVTKAVAWSTNSDHTIPESYYLDSKPSWFYSLDWPPFDSATGYTNRHWSSIPAGYRYLYTTNPPAESGSSGNRSATVSGTFRAY